MLGLVAEREQGTLARLRSMPMNPGLIVEAKAMVSFDLGVVATSVLLTAGSRLFDVSFGHRSQWPPSRCARWRPGRR